LSEKIEYWLGLADYDIDVAKSLWQTGKYLYVGFMCHQAIEKALKAVIARDCAVGEIPPKIHNLVRLSDISGLTDIITPKQSVFLETLNPLNVEARYPEYKNQIAAALTSDYCQDLIKETEELLCWIKQQL
jgi:HEPN domain-containing protein